MKRWILLLLLLGWYGEGRCQSPSEVFDAANRLYQEGKFAEAQERYESILANGFESSDLYLNLGNTCFRMGNVAGAVLNYERGLRISPGDEDMQFNRELAGMMTVDRIETTPRLFIWDYWDGLKSAFSPQGVFWSAYISYVLVFVFLSVLLVAGSYSLRRVALIGSIVATAVCAVLVVVAVGRYADLSREDQAVVMSQIVSVKNSPDATSTDAFVLHAGARVQITESVGSWVQIRLADGKVGWVEGTAVEVI